MSEPRRYLGRFAPSPTGPLHFGSLVAALGCALEARRNGGGWLLRVEDLDTARNVAGATGSIVRTLEALGFEWEQAVTHQSLRLDRYREALEQLERNGAAFWCGCTRRETGPGPYPGTCRHGLPEGKHARSLRFRVGEAVETFVDRVQGPQSQPLDRAGDFVVLRADGVFAYQLAVCVDDLAQGITDIVRGADLLSSTGQQRALLRALLPAGAQLPDYAHLPVALQTGGAKLSKQTAAPAVDSLGPGRALYLALQFLGQAPPCELRHLSPREIWRWMDANWDLARVPADASAAPQVARSP